MARGGDKTFGYEFKTLIGFLKVLNYIKIKNL